jgi:hypothetical protein
MTDWSEPVKSQGSAWNFDSEPELIAVFEQSEKLDVADTFSDVAGAMRVQTIHRLRREGEPVDVWGSADLDGKLRGVEPGTLVRIVYLGKEELEGGKQIKRFQLQTAAGELSANASVAAQDDIPF